MTALRPGAATPGAGTPGAGTPGAATLSAPTPRAGTLSAATLPARTLRLGTRGSALALAQSGQVARQLTAALAAPVELVPIRTQGDSDPRALVSIGGTGVFVTALRSALLAGEVDLVVHSLKDLPTAPAAGLVLAAVPAREDPADVLVAAAGLAELPAGARVGTGAPRRAAQLAALRPDLEIVPVRGNVDTRIAAVRAGRMHGVVLARAGLARLGRLSDVAHTFTAGQMLPAPGQGALAVECRADEPELAAALAGALDDAASRAAVRAERALLAALEAGCSAPVGALAEVAGDTLVLQAVVGGGLRQTARAPYDWGAGGEQSAAALGRTLAEQLIAAGAMDVLGTTTEKVMGQ
jgi:hydroxymethylbilane synthase